MQATLFTAPLMIETANSSGYAIYLNVLNVSSSPRGGTLQILQLDGSEIGAASYNSVAPGVGTGIQVQTFQNTAPITLVYGKVTVNGQADSIRANLVLIDAKGNSLISIEAS